MSDIQIISSTQKIFVDPASSSVSVINAGPPGPNTGVPGPPGVVQEIVPGALIKVNSSNPHMPIVSADAQILTGKNDVDVSLGSLPAGPMSWPIPAREIAQYAPAVSFYTEATGAKVAGIYGVSYYFTATPSDPNFLTMNIVFSGRACPQSVAFAFSASAGYVEGFLNVGQHMLWQVFKGPGFAATTSATVRFGLTYRPVNVLSLAKEGEEDE